MFYIFEAKEIDSKIKVEYSQACLVNVKDRTYLVENFIDGEFSKFTSNEYLLDASQYSEDEKKLIEFSHWTHQWTDQNLMVVDLQGFKKDNQYHLTDPAIHSRQNQFGQTDLGSNGFVRFFLFHHKPACCLDGNFK